eukprot:10465392-Heterocapsa_arctica.AAC.1
MRIVREANHSLPGRRSLPSHPSVLRVAGHSSGRRSFRPARRSSLSAYRTFSLGPPWAPRCEPTSIFSVRHS